MLPDLLTPYEKGNKNQTATWEECISFYQHLAQRFPTIVKFFQIGNSDAGVPLYAGVVTADGVFDVQQIKREGRPVFFNNNGIHPGEPEGIDVCMALVRDFCVEPGRLAALGRTVFLFIPIYNVDGSWNRNASSRVNQDGPELFGFRGNALHLDLNRDFIKCDSLNAQAFNQLFCHWSPDVMVDTHTSNGADYSYTMTLIQTQADKLGAELGGFLRSTMLPQIYEHMQQRGWPTCPYVNPVNPETQIPDDGIEDFLEVPRFSTGYAALHHTIGFMPETHMLKPYADRYESMRALVEVVLDFTVSHAEQIQTLRAQARRDYGLKTEFPVTWKADRSKPSRFRFKGYAAVYSPSLLGNYTRLAYDRNQPWEKDIAYYDNFVADSVVKAPKAYVIPQAWREVIARLQWNGVQLQRIESAHVANVEVYYISQVTSRATPYEGHLFHDAVQLDVRAESVMLRAGDYLLPLDQPAARYAVETLEPQAHDSLFRWGFFNSVLEKKEAFSDYVFEDTALELLQSEPELKTQFELWKKSHPELLADQNAVLSFIFTHSLRYREPEWRRYPVLRVM